MPKQAHVETTYPKDALERLYRNEHDGRLKERLLAMLFLYEGKKYNLYGSTSEGEPSKGKQLA